MGIRREKGYQNATAGPIAERIFKMIGDEAVLWSMASVAFHVKADVQLRWAR